MQQRPVREDHLEPPFDGAQAIAVKKREVRHGGIGPALAVDVRLAFNDGEVGWRRLRGIRLRKPG
jgi:hypothetical protein